MENQQKKISVFFIAAIVFAALAVICVISNMIYYISTIKEYMAYGYTFKEVAPYIYVMFQPLEIFGGVSLILFALDTIIKKMPDKNKEEVETSLEDNLITPEE